MEQLKVYLSPSKEQYLRNGTAQGLLESLKRAVLRSGTAEGLLESLKRAVLRNGTAHGLLEFLKRAVPQEWNSSRSTRVPQKSSTSGMEQLKVYLSPSKEQYIRNGTAQRLLESLKRAVPQEWNSSRST